MKLIGITGLAGSGKDTAALYLTSRCGFTRMAFADPVKEAARAIFGLTAEETWNPEYKNKVIPYWDMTPRQMFQRLGDEAAQGTFGPQVWVKRLWMAFDMIRDTDDVVISDVRYELEALMVRQEGGVLIEIKRGSGLGGEEGRVVVGCAQDVS